MRSARHIHPMIRRVDFICKVIAFPLAEEWFFRKFVRDVQYDIDCGDWKKKRSIKSTCSHTLFNAGFFTLCHMKVKSGFYSNFYSFISSFCAGALFFRLVEKTDDIIAPWVSHSTLNFFIRRSIKRHR